MKAVMISIQPKWIEKIANGEKTIEVRKTRPKEETPFKCYIYCTKAPKGWVRFDRNVQLDTKVIGEFICDTIITDHTFGHDPLFYAMSGMTAVEIAVYCTERNMYGWHISNLKIYDKPKELSEFKVTRPPQSWCYVEEREDNA